MKPSVFVRAWSAGLVFALLVPGLSRAGDDKSIVVASTTSTQDSGLFEYLLPIFKRKTGHAIRGLHQLR